MSGLHDIAKITAIADVVPARHEKILLYCQAFWEFMLLYCQKLSKSLKTPSTWTVKDLLNFWQHGSINSQKAWQYERIFSCCAGPTKIYYYVVQAQHLAISVTKRNVEQAQHRQLEGHFQKYMAIKGIFLKTPGT